MIVKCCKCRKDYPLGDNIFKYEKDTNCLILICPYCGFKHAINFTPFDNKIENLKKVEKLNLAYYYPLLGASRIANASRVDQSTIDNGNIEDGVPWDISIVVYADKSKLITQDTSPRGVAFSSDGTKMYIMGKTNATVYQYTLTTPWDVSTATYADKSKLVSEQDETPESITFSSDGTKMYIIGYTNDTVYQYTLTAWDVSTAVYADKSKLITQDFNPYDVAFSSDGTKMYIMGTTNDTVYQYTLTVAWDVSTAVYAKSKLVTAQDTSPRGVTFSSDGTKMYIMGYTNDTVYQYALSVAWDVSTAVYAKSKLVTAQDTSPRYVAFSSDGTKMYIMGTTNDTVYQYTKTAWDKTNDFILATRIYGSKGAYNFAYKLKWRNVTDGGVFADVEVTGEISFNADTVLVDGQALLTGSKICDAQPGAFTWQNGLESEGDNILPDSGTYSLADEYYTELQWALDCNGAHDGDVYEFALYELTNGTSIGTCLAKITMGITDPGGFKWNTKTILKWCDKVISKWNTK